LDVRITGVGGTSRWVDGARSAGWGLMAAGRVTCGEAIGNTQTMTGVPAPTLYHRWLGWHAPAMRRAVTVLIAGLIVAVAQLRCGTGAADWRRRAHRHAVVDRDEHGLHPALRRPALPVHAGGHRVRRPGGARAARLPRLCLRRVHHRHDLPGVGHHAARSPDPALRARPRDLVLPVRRGHRGGFGQPHLRTDPLILPDPSRPAPRLLPSHRPP